MNPDLDGRDIFDLRQEAKEAKKAEDWESATTDAALHLAQESVDLQFELDRLYPQNIVRLFSGENQWAVLASMLQQKAPEVPVWRVKEWLRVKHGAKFWGDR